MIYTGLLCHALFYKQEATLPAFVKYLAKLRKLNDLPATSDDAYDYRAVLRALVAYYDEHNQLPPDRRALLEYQKVSKDHAIRMNLMIEDAVKSLKDSFDETELKSITDPVILVTKVIEDAKKEYLDYQMTVARCIMNSGPTAKVGKYKDPAGLDDAKTMLIQSLIGMNDDSEETDPNESILSGGVQPIQMRVINAASITTERLEWLWFNKVPLGFITLYVGKPDNGKSLAALDLAARVSTGKDFPDGEKNTLGARSVLCAFSEDDESRTIVPRLVAAGADLTKILILRKVIDPEGVKRNLALKDDARVLQEKLLANPDIALVILDPISAFFGDADSNRDKDIRPVLEALGEAMRKSLATCVGIIHCNKRSDVDALGKILGASSVAGVVRAAWDFSRDPDNKEEFMMTHIKGNLSKKRSGVRYKTTGVLVKIGDGSEQEHPHIEWLGETEDSANEVLNKTRDNAKSGGDLTKESKASLLINLMLDSPAGDVKATDLYSKGESEGLSVPTIKAASYSMKHVGKERRGGQWYWFDKRKREAATEQYDRKMMDTEVM